jgi:aspartate/methionine/tyrosine aminotransferase
MVIAALRWVRNTAVSYRPKLQKQVVVLLSSMSKSLSLTGWRLVFCVAGNPVTIFVLKCIKNPDQYLIPHPPGRPAQGA